MSTFKGIQRQSLSQQLHTIDPTQWEITRFRPAVMEVLMALVSTTMRQR